MATTNGRRYLVVDVFTQRALEGNALAVFPDGMGLDDGTMQRIAKELNLSETVFVFPPTSAEFAARLRIFTPSREMPFAGHPTVGTSFVLLSEGLVAKGTKQFVLEEKIGPVPVRIEGDGPLIWLTTPPIREERTYDADLCARVLGLEPSDLLPAAPQMLTAGNPTIFVAVKNKEAVDRAWLGSGGMSELQGPAPDPACMFVFCPTPEGAYSRMFAPEYGILEDPATGSSTGPLAAYMLRHKLVADTAGTRFISEQGTKMGRRSLLHVHLVGQGGSEGIEVGGHVTPFAEATMRI